MNIDEVAWNAKAKTIKKLKWDGILLYFSSIVKEKYSKICFLLEIH
jgi:hypothetical protein